jgi:tetratricopeptide (TPR) repeat protein
MASATLLREAIAAVKAGQRQYARELFLELVEVDPTNELAWVWLSGLLESREEQIRALENSITISKGGPGLEGRLQRLDRVRTGPELEQFRAAIKALDGGDRKRGKSLLEQVVASNRDHERAWMTLADLSADDEEQVSALEQVVRINPNNFKARERLTKVQHLLYQSYLSLGRSMQQQGDLDRAINAYKAAEKYASTGSFREAARQRWQLVETRSEPIVPSGLTAGTVFSAGGPPLLFFILVLVQSDLRLEQLSPFYIYCTGGLAVTAGSLLLTASKYTPRRPMWGSTGLAASGTKAWVRAFGWLLLLLPFLLWLLGAAARMDLIPFPP